MDGGRGGSSSNPSPGRTRHHVPLTRPTPRTAATIGPSHLAEPRFRLPGDGDRGGSSAGARSPVTATIIRACQRSGRSPGVRELVLRLRARWPGGEPDLGCIRRRGAQPIGQRNDVRVRLRLELLLQQQRVQSACWSAPARSPASSSAFISRSVTRPLYGSSESRSRHRSTALLHSPRSSAASASFPDSGRTTDATGPALRPPSARTRPHRAGESHPGRDPYTVRSPARTRGPHRVLEGDHVARDCGRIQPQLVLNRDYPGFTDLPSQRVDALVQQVARALHVALGPEPAHQLVPALGPRSGGGQEGKERKPVSLRGRPGKRTPITG
jgi:hypothetical protein